MSELWRKIADSDFLPEMWPELLLLRLHGRPLGTARAIVGD
jgi:hypothetical protein